MVEGNQCRRRNPGKVAIVRPAAATAVRDRDDSSLLKFTGPGQPGRLPALVRYFLAVLARGRGSGRWGRAWESESRAADTAAASSVVTSHVSTRRSTRALALGASVTTAAKAVPGSRASRSDSDSASSAEPGRGGRRLPVCKPETRNTESPQAAPQSTGPSRRHSTAAPRRRARRAFRAVAHSVRAAGAEPDS